MQYSTIQYNEIYFGMKIAHSLTAAVRATKKTSEQTENSSTQQNEHRK